METAGDRAPRFTADVNASPQRRPWAWLLTLALHALVLMGVVIVPLLREEPLPRIESPAIAAFLTSPLAAPAAPPPPPAPRAAAPISPVARDSATPFTIPAEVPEAALQEASLDIGLAGGIPGGVEDGVPGGVVGGIVGAVDAGPPPPPKLVSVGGVVHAPRKIKDVPTVYPDAALQARIQGVVVLECTISANGRVEDVHVVQGRPPLDAAAIEAVRKWVYTPTLVDGVPVRVLMNVTVTFVLRKGLG